MAKRTVVTMVDDLTNEQLDEAGGETVTFSMDGTTYEIDLSHDNAREMRDAFGQYVSVARRLNLGHTRHTAPRTRRDSERKRTQEIRRWAIFKGMLEEGSRGRVPRQVVEAWENRSLADKVADDTAMRGQTSIDTDTDTVQEEPKPKRSRRKPVDAPDFQPPEAPSQSDVPSDEPAEMG